MALPIFFSGNLNKSIKISSMHLGKRKRFIQFASFCLWAIPGGIALNFFLMIGIGPRT